MPFGQEGYYHAMNFYPQLLRNRPHMTVALVLGLAAGYLAPASVGLAARILLGWDIAVWAYLVMIWAHMLLSSRDDVRARASIDDEKAVTVLAVICAATIASVLAILFELGSTGVAPGSQTFRSTLTGMTLLGAWFLIPTIFTLHYARVYYASDRGKPALVFPDGALEPDYLDLLYFSFTIAVASQTADIGLRASSARRAVLAQAILSFYFNVAVLGLCINVAAGMLGK
jgi:uncharacterized membrane protein